MSYLLAGISILSVNLFNLVIHEREPVIAVLPFKVTGIDRRLSSIVSNTVRTSLISQRQRVIRRDQMEQVFNEWGIPESKIECSQRSCGVILGKILKVDKVVVGEILLRGEEVFIAFSMIDVASAWEEKSVQDVIKFNSNIKPYTRKVRKLSYQLLGNIPPGFSKTDVFLLATGIGAGAGWFIYEQTNVEYGQVDLIAEFP